MNKQSTKENLQMDDKFMEKKIPNWNKENANKRQPFYK